jgi:hypothetical protein
MTILEQSRATIRNELRQAVFDCRERGLYEAASWAAQHLTSLPAQTEPVPYGAAVPGGAAERDAYLVAKSLFDCKVRCRTCRFWPASGIVLCSTSLTCAGVSEVFTCTHGLMPGGEGNVSEILLSLSGWRAQKTVRSCLDRMSVRIRRAARTNSQPVWSTVQTVHLETRGKACHLFRVVCSVLLSV